MSHAAIDLFKCKKFNRKITKLEGQSDILVERETLKRVQVKLLTLKKSFEREKSKSANDLLLMLNPQIDFEGKMQ